MKKKALLVSTLCVVVLISACGGKKRKTSSTSFSSYSNNYNVATERDYTLNPGSNSFKIIEIHNNGITSCQDGTIFNAWNWSIEKIMEKLPLIAKCGFTSIQLSPLQDYKGYSQLDNINQYAKIYNPVSFSIATKNHSLGTKEELIKLCEEAKKYNIKVLAEVIFNHLLGTSTTQLDPIVKEYEPEIYGEGGNIDEGALVHIGSTNMAYDDSSYYTTHGSTGHPDLDTSSSVVQNRACSLLKEYLDAGVSGFLFDEAKYIETPFDGPGDSSSFWASVLSYASSYALENSMDSPYFYGDIDGDIGKDRSLSWYTAMMSIIDNQTSSNYLNIIKNHDFSTFDASYLSLQPGIKVSLNSITRKNYENDEIEEQSVILHNYALEASRKNSNASLLSPSYFGKRSESSINLGEVDNYDFLNETVEEINAFHNEFYDASENIYADANSLIITRSLENKVGFFISSNLNEIEVKMDEKAIDGTYIDAISGNEFTIENNIIKGTLSSLKFGLIYKKEARTISYGSPSVSMTGNGVFNTDTYTSNISIYNAKEAFLSVDGNDRESVSDNAYITFGSDMDSGEKITIKFYLVGLDDSLYEKEFTFIKKIENGNESNNSSTSSESKTGVTSISSATSQGTTNSNNSTISSSSEENNIQRIYFTDNKNWNNVYIYFWSDSLTNKWPGEKMEYYGCNEYNQNVYYYDLDFNKYSYIIFSNGSTQTVNITLGGYNGYYILDIMDGSKYLVGGYNK